MDRFSPVDGVMLVSNGIKMLKKPNPVFMQQRPNDFEVETNEGVLKAKAGDFLAHDPISGHVWPVAASYVAQHYVPMEETNA